MEHINNQLVRGLYYGEDDIPKEWIDKLVKKDFVRYFGLKLDELD